MPCFPIATLRNVERTALVPGSVVTRQESLDDSIRAAPHGLHHGATKAS